MFLVLLARSEAKLIGLEVYDGIDGLWQFQKKGDNPNPYRRLLSLTLTLT